MDPLVGGLAGRDRAMTMCIRGTGFLLLLFAVAFGAPNYAVAQPPVPTSGAVLYELTENLNLKALRGGQRKATSQLLGTALAGTPLCPTALAHGAPACTLTATGSDDISLTTGLGNFGGTFTVVVQGDNPVDSPELVIGRGHFSGKMDFSPAIPPNNVPLGSVVGEVGLNGSRRVPSAGRNTVDGLLPRRQRQLGAGARERAGVGLPDGQVRNFVLRHAAARGARPLPMVARASEAKPFEERWDPMLERLGNVIGVDDPPLAVRADIRRPDEGVVISRGTRVYLRTFTPRDLAWLTEWVDDPYLERMVGSEFLHAFKHDWDKGPGFHNAVMSDPTQVVLIVEAYRGWTKPVGVVRLFNIHMLEGYAFLETIITDRRAVRRGYGVEAGKLISYYGVDVLGVRRIEAKVYAYNVLSMNSLRRNGFHQEGVLRQAGFDGTRYWDVVVFGILKDEIEAVRKRDKVYLPLDEPEGNVIEPT